MGCDYFHSGILFDIELQEKVIEFVQSYYSDVDLVIHPQSESKYPTFIGPRGRGERGMFDNNCIDTPILSF